MIGIFDSGIGGLGIFQEIRQLMPNEQILYLADSANCPYGEKNEREIKQICLANSRFLIEQGADIIVVACNTASTIALEYLRSEFAKMTLSNHIPLTKWNMVQKCQSIIVGVVPVVKTCSEVSKNKRIGILATKRTVESQYLRDLVDQYCPESNGYKIYYQAANELVEMVENFHFSFFNFQLMNQLDNFQKINKNLKLKIKNYQLLEKYLSEFISEKVDVVALGCTHFPFLRPQIEEILGPKVKVLDSNGAVARQTARIMNYELGIRNKDKYINHNSLFIIPDSKKYQFFTTGDPQKLQKQIQNLIGLKHTSVDKVTFQ